MGRLNFRKRLLTGAMMTMIAISSAAQARPKTSTAVPSLNITFMYQATHANLVTNPYFWMQGGSAQIEGRFYGGWGAVADISAMHVANMNASGVGLDLVTATFGPRYTWRLPKNPRYEIYGQALAGVANGFNSTFPGPISATTTASSLAAKAGGGMNLNLRTHVALRLFEADYLRTKLPNATNNAQNNLQLGAGIIFRFR